MAGATETRSVREWVEGVSVPPTAAVKRLRLALDVAQLIEQSQGASIVPTWFQGVSPFLGDRSPARAIREGDLEVTASAVRETAEAFAAA